MYSHISLAGKWIAVFRNANTIMGADSESVIVNFHRNRIDSRCARGLKRLSGWLFQIVCVAIDTHVTHACVILCVKTCKVKVSNAIIFFSFVRFVHSPNDAFFHRNRIEKLSNCVFYSIAAGWIWFCAAWRFNGGNIDRSGARRYMDLWSTITVRCSIQKCQCRY